MGKGGYHHKGKGKGKNGGGGGKGKDLEAEKRRLLSRLHWDHWALSRASDALLSDKEFMLEAAKQGGRVLQYAAPDIRADPEVVLEALRWDGWALGDTTEELRSDRHIVMESVRRNEFSFRYAQGEMLHDKAFMLQMVSLGVDLHEVCEEFQNDKDIVMRAVLHNPKSLQKAVDQFRLNPGFILEAVQADWHVLNFAEQRFRDDQEIMFAAIAQEPRALCLASEGFRRNKLTVIKAIRINFHVLQYADESLRRDWDVLLEAARYSTEIGRFAIPPEVFDNPSFRTACDTRLAGLGELEPLLQVKFSDIGNGQVRATANILCTEDWDPVVYAELPKEATIERLAELLWVEVLLDVLETAREGGPDRIHLVLRQGEGPVSPFDAQRLVSEWCDF